MALRVKAVPKIAQATRKFSAAELHTIVDVLDLAKIPGPEQDYLQAQVPNALTFEEEFRAGADFPPPVGKLKSLPGIYRVLALFKSVTAPKTEEDPAKEAGSSLDLNNLDDPSAENGTVAP